MRPTNRRPSVFADKVSCSLVGIYSSYHNGWSWTLLGYSRQAQLRNRCECVYVCSCMCVDARWPWTSYSIALHPFLLSSDRVFHLELTKFGQTDPRYPLAFLDSPGIIGQSSQNWPFYLNARNLKSSHPCSSTTELLETLLRLERWLSS